MKCKYSQVNKEVQSCKLKIKTLTKITVISELIGGHKFQILLIQVCKKKLWRCKGVWKGPLSGLRGSGNSSKLRHKEICAIHLV